MIRRLVVRSAAELDIAQAALWYETERPGLGGKFLDAVDDLLARIVETPLQFPEIAPGVRRGFVRRFPYGVYFAAESMPIAVLAVLHLHRDPDAWRRGRVKG